MGARNRSGLQRQRLAYEAARIMAEQGITEFEHARRKAAERARVSDRRTWPSNEEIQQALVQRLRLFQREKQDAEIRQLRNQALEAMRAFARFNPRLVGPVLAGTADSAGGVRLHLFADNPEEIALTLIEQRIPWQQREIALRFSGGTRHQHPALTFVAGETPFELIILPLAAERNPPLDAVSERPERGADIRGLERLLGEDASAGAPL